jgi:glycosyltransferase involved in cell wall biosynthesis
MAFDLPVIAYEATGVPYAMGGAGLLVNAKRYDLIAELIGLLMRDAALHKRVIDGQHRRLQALAPSRVAEHLRSYIAGVASA